MSVVSGTESSALENLGKVHLNKDTGKDHLLLEAGASHMNNSRLQQARTICGNKESLIACCYEQFTCFK